MIGLLSLRKQLRFLCFAFCSQTDVTDYATTILAGNPAGALLIQTPRSFAPPTTLVIFDTQPIASPLVLASS